MKVSRLITYGIAGIIVGLLLENQAIVLKQRAKDATGRAKKELARKVSAGH